MFDSLDPTLVRIGSAVVVAVVAVLAGRLVRYFACGPLARAKTPSFGNVMSRLTGYAVTTFGLGVAITIAFPSVDPVDFFAGLGILSIAAGFAFQDILSNMLSGVLLLLRQPFAGGDQIEVNGVSGTVEGITIRETTLKTFDGTRVYIPNKDVYQSVIDVQTAFDQRRGSVTVGVSYDDDLDQARSLALEAMRSVPQVADDPEPEAFLVAFGGSSMDIDLRYWCDSDQHSFRATQDAVIAAVKARFDEAGIDIPFPIRTLSVADDTSRLVRRQLTAAGNGTN